MTGFVLVRDSLAGVWRAVQGHLSLMRGILQQSFGRHTYAGT